MAIVLATSMCLEFAFVQIVTWWFAADGSTVRANFILLGALGACYAVWMWFVCRRSLPAETGAGLTLAGYALCCRATTELMGAFTMFDPQQTITADIHEAVAIGRSLGLVAYLGGLAFFAWACFTAWRTRDRWAMTPVKSATSSKADKRALGEVFE